MINPVRRLRSTNHLRQHSLRLRRIQHYWKLACRYDHVSTTVLSAQFTESNPYVTKLYQVLQQASSVQRACWRLCKTF